MGVCATAEPCRVQHNNELSGHLRWLIPLLAGINRRSADATADRDVPPRGRMEIHVEIRVVDPFRLVAAAWS